MLHESQPETSSESNGNKKIKSASNGSYKSNDPISSSPSSTQGNIKGSAVKTSPTLPPQPILNNSTTTTPSKSKKKKNSS